MDQVNQPPPENDRPEGAKRRFGGGRFGLLWLVTLVLAVPIVPVVLLGELALGVPTKWQAEPPGDSVIAATVAGVLALDILLPVPSGPLLTLAGGMVGGPIATAAGWLGLTVGALAAFAASKAWGAPLVSRLASEEDLRKAQASATAAEAMLLATRPLPVLAEAAVLWAGLVGVPWSRFLPAVLAGNLMVAAFFAFAGQWAADRGWLLPALAAACALPLGLLAWVRRR